MSDWKTWFNSLDTSHKQQLRDVVLEETKNIQILQQPTEDFLVDGCPPFVDVHNLIDTYNKVAFVYNLLVKGPKGDGKSLSFTYWASTTKTPLIVVECSQDTKTRDLIGTLVDLNRFQLGPIPTAIDIANTYGRAIIAFEEVNALTPQIQKSLNALLDFRKFVNVPKIGRRYELKNGAQLWCVATMNPSVYGGTYDLNEDLRSRWTELEVGYPLQSQEKRIIKAHYPDMNLEMDRLLDNCLSLATDTRQAGTGYALSIRDVVNMVGLAQAIGINDALQLTACKFEGEDRDTVIRRIKANFSNVKKVKKYWGSPS